MPETIKTPLPTGLEPDFDVLNPENLPEDLPNLDESRVLQADEVDTEALIKALQDENSSTAYPSPSSKK